MTSAASIKAAQRTSDVAGPLMLVTLSSTGWAQPVRLVNDTRNWISNGNTFTGLQMSYRLPNDAAGEEARLQLEMVNVGREITAELEALPAGSTILATIQFATRATPSVIDYEFVGEMVGVKTTLTSVSAQIANDSVGRRSACVLRYDPRVAPGLFST